jgi:hypothetical protein
MVGGGSKLREVLARIEKRLAVVELSAAGASKKAGLSESAIRNIQRAVKDKKRAGVSTATLVKLAPALRTSVAWLMDGVGDEDAGGEPRTIQLRGLVGAGDTTIAYAEGDPQAEAIEAPEYANENTIALEIRGTSLGSSFDGWVLFYDDVRSPVTDDLIGRLCVVGLEDGRVLVKEIRRGTLPGRFTLWSNHPPIYDAPVLWAARVRGMRPR